MQNFIVYGHCDKGIKFRPSDWTERLVNAHTVAQQSKQCVHIFNINGIKGIKVKTCLEETNLMLLNESNLPLSIKSLFTGYILVIGIGLL
ncbi:hypothetical protein [uncultured Gammaproteobacteria bacterium]|jgi:hypothetical protein|nr:hypothetical protein [uncultured Gammaproteobacteria bacterium]